MNDEALSVTLVRVATHVRPKLRYAACQETENGSKGNHWMFIKRQSEASWDAAKFSKKDYMSRQVSQDFRLRSNATFIPLAMSLITTSYCVAISFRKIHNSSLVFSDSSVTTCSNIHPHNEIKIPSDGNIVGAKKPKAPRIGPDLLFIECTLLYSNNVTVERWKCGLDSNCEAYWRFPSRTVCTFIAPLLASRFISIQQLLMAFTLSHRLDSFSGRHSDNCEN